MSSFESYASDWIFPAEKEALGFLAIEVEKVQPR